MRCLEHLLQLNGRRIYVSARRRCAVCNLTAVTATCRHLTNYEQQEWIRRRFEAPHAAELTGHQKKVLFKRLIRSTKFEEFLSKKWPSEKRFGLEGCEVLIPAIKQVIDRSSMLGVDSVVIGMPHRGRLNVLSNVCRQPLATILSQFSTLEPSDEGSGDVKYHLGVCVERLNRQSDRDIKIAVVANPSHLEGGRAGRWPLASCVLNVV